MGKTVMNLTRRFTGVVSTVKVVVRTPMVTVKTPMAKDKTPMVSRWTRTDHAKILDRQERLCSKRRTGS
jgi:hypothetical protein